MSRIAQINLELSPYIPGPPQTPDQLYGQSCANDKSTINHWRDTWLRQIKANHEKHGPFKDRGLGQLFQKHVGKPAILVGSGPSLGYNGHELARAKNCVILSCLHNFHFCIDKGIDVDYYVTLDAGDITIKEVSEGGTQQPGYYWEQTKGKTLIAYIGTHPDLLERWQGDIIFFNCPLPDLGLQKEIEETEKFGTMVSSGGSVLGACFYISKAILGCLVTAFVGADFCFSYQNKFHGWESSYDLKMGHCIRATDIYGIPVKTWPSYNNFKAWFDCMACKVPGIYYNCSEGGTLGAYKEGNILQIKQSTLREFIDMINMSEQIRQQCEDPESEQRIILF